MIGFLIFVLVGLIIGLIIISVIGRILLHFVPQESKTGAKAFIAGVTVVLAVIYFYLVLLIIDAQFDEEDLFTPSEASKLAEWTEACATSLAPGTPLEEADRYVRDKGVLPAEETTIHPDYERMYYRVFRQDTKVNIDIVDKNVRNWSAFGDLDVSINVALEDDVVVRCGARIDKHGR